MIAFDHDALTKARRSIMIVYVMIVGTSLYVESLDGMNVLGSDLTLSKEDVIGWLALSIFYLWVVLLTQQERHALDMSLETLEDVQAEADKQSGIKTSRSV